MSHGGKRKTNEGLLPGERETKRDCKQKRLTRSRSRVMDTVSPKATKLSNQNKKKGENPKMVRTNVNRNSAKNIAFYEMSNADVNIGSNTIKRSRQGGKARNINATIFPKLDDLTLVSDGIDEITIRYHYLCTSSQAKKGAQN